MARPDRGVPRRPRDWRESDDTTAAFVLRYRPYSVATVMWDRLRPLFVEVAALVIYAPHEKQPIANALVGFLSWAYGEGLELIPAVFHPDVIDRYINSLTHLNRGARQNKKTFLHRAGRVMLGAPLYPPPSLTNKRPDLESPYDDSGVDALVASLRGLPTRRLQENATVMVSVGLGVGPWSQEFLALLGSDVEQDEQGVQVKITTGANPRTIPVVRTWERQVAAAAARAGDRPLFLSDRRRVQRYDATSFITNLPVSDAPHLTLRHLRATWIVRHLRAGVPLNVLAPSAGASVEQLGRYAKYLPQPSPEHARALLRGRAQ